MKIGEPGYNDFIQQALFSYFAGVTSKENDPALAESNFNEAGEYADKAAKILPDNYKPKKIQET